MGMKGYLMPPRTPHPTALGNRSQLLLISAWKTASRPWNRVYDRRSPQMRSLRPSVCTKRHLPVSRRPLHMRYDAPGQPVVEGGHMDLGPLQGPKATLERQGLRRTSCWISEMEAIRVAGRYFPQARATSSRLSIEFMPASAVKIARHSCHPLRSRTFSTVQTSAVFPGRTQLFTGRPSGVTARF